MLQKANKVNKDSSVEATPNKGVVLKDNRDIGTPIQRKPNNTGLPDKLKSGIENLSGHSMDDVKVHYNSSKPTQLNAHAYAQGTDIHVASGQEKHLPHEAWHVVQQKQGRVKPTVRMNGVNVNDNAGLENEADVQGAKALQFQGKSNSTIKQTLNTSNSDNVQAKFSNNHNRVVKGISGMFEAMHSKSSNPVHNQPVAQKNEARANWRVMARYNSGTAAKEVAAAFGRAGYVIGPGLLKIIVRLMEENGFGNEKWAHGTGDNSSGKQGDTDIRIQACKNFLIQWAGSHPAPREDVGSSSRSGYKASKAEKASHAKKKAENKQKVQAGKKSDYATGVLLEGGVTQEEINAFKAYYHYIPASVEQFRELEQHIE